MSEFVVIYDCRSFSVYLCYDVLSVCQYVAMYCKFVYDVCGHSGMEEQLCQMPEFKLFNQSIN